jgi:hypothetical protein
MPETRPGNAPEVVTRDVQFAPVRTVLNERMVNFCYRVHVKTIVDKESSETNPTTHVETVMISVIARMVVAVARRATVTHARTIRAAMAIVFQIAKLASAR